MPPRRSSTVLSMLDLQVAGRVQFSQKLSYQTMYNVLGDCSPRSAEQLPAADEWELQHGPHCEHLAAITCPPPPPR